LHGHEFFAGQFDGFVLVLGFELYGDGFGQCVGSMWPTAEPGPLANMAPSPVANQTSLILYTENISFISVAEGSRFPFFHSRY
jgi:hypothetical protein